MRADEGHQTFIGYARRGCVRIERLAEAAAIDPVHDAVHRCAKDAAQVEAGIAVAGGAREAQSFRAGRHAVYAAVQLACDAARGICAEHHE